MRQSDGTDLLGANDPRSASIGIIRVDPTDVRQDVLTAILAQDELKRSQIAVVLHENNRAFQRPVDFDGLKDMRRTLKAELVFVARDGRGPAEFARQRRFTVYPSLESFATALREDPPDGENKKGWFGRRQKNTPPVARETRAAPNTGALDLRQPLPVSLLDPAPDGGYPAAAAAVSGQTWGESRREVDEDDIPTLTNTNNAGYGENGAGLNGAVGAAALRASMLDDQDADLLPPPPVKSNGAGAASPPASLNGAGEQSAGTGRASHTPPSLRAVEPGIISLPAPKPRPRSTLKLPAAALEAPEAIAAVAPKPVKNGNGNTGKQRAVLAAGVAGAGVAAASGAAAFASTRAPSAASGAPPGAAPAGAPPGAGGTPPGRRSRRRLLALLLVVLTLLLLAGIALASPLGQHIIPNTTTTATVTITPRSQNVSDTYLITAVTGTPNPTAREVKAQFISTTVQNLTESANATGSIQGRKATGPLLFINTGTGSVFVSGGTLTGKSGVPIAFGAVTIPIGSITITGVAVNQGTSGNIPALDIFGSCCGNSNILVRNPSAFGGGVNPQLNTIITQNDINTATNKLKSAALSMAPGQLKGQVKAGQDVAPNTLSCTPKGVQANHKVGDNAKSVTVSGSATCSEEVYDKAGALSLATAALKVKAASSPGADYAPVDNKILTTVTQVSVIDASKHILQVQVFANGVWVYQFPTSLKQQLAGAIANKSKSDALTYLKAQPGILDATISISSGDTLPGANDITIIVKAVAGPSGTPTSVPSSPIPTTAPGVTPTPQNGQGGS